MTDGPLSSPPGLVLLAAYWSAGLSTGPTIQIWNGQYERGAGPVLLKNDVGAFAVANGGLMKLVLNPPTEPPANTMTLLVTGNVKLWYHPWKGQAVALNFYNEKSFDTNKGPITLWGNRKGEIHG